MHDLDTLRKLNEEKVEREGRRKTLIDMQTRGWTNITFGFIGKVYEWYLKAKAL